MNIRLHGRITETGKLEVDDLPPGLPVGDVVIDIMLNDTSGWIPPTTTPAEVIRYLEENPPGKYGDIGDDEDAIDYLRRIRNQKIWWTPEDDLLVDGEE